VPGALVGSKKKGSDRWVEHTKLFSASKCPKHYGSSRSIGIKLALACPVALSRRWRQSASARAFSPEPALSRPPDARPGIALALPPPAHVADASWHMGAHPAALSYRVGHLAQHKMSVCCLQVSTHRHPPLTTTLTSLHYLPSSLTSDPRIRKTCPPPTFSASPPFPHAPPRQAGAVSPTTPYPPSPPPRPPVQAALPRRLRRLVLRRCCLSPRRHRLARPSKPYCPADPAASPPRRHRLARRSKMRFPTVATAFPPHRRRLARIRCCLAPPSPTAGDGHSVAFCDQAAGICPPPAAAANVRTTSRGGRGGRRRSGAAREEVTEGRGGGGRVIHLRVAGKTKRCR